MSRFAYTPEITARFPHVVGAILDARGLHNQPTPPEVLALYQAEQAAVRERIGETPLSELPSLAAWRAAFRAFGVDPTQHRSAGEALLRRLTKQGDIPSINLLVDLGNLISIRHAVPVAILDTRALTGTLYVRFAAGDERFTNLGATELDPPAPDEVIFSDDTDLVFARRWCWRQSDESAARDTTTDALITIEGHHDGARRDVEAAAADLSDLLTQYTGVTIVESVILDANSTAK